MISTISPVVAGLTTGHKIGLAAVGAAFILFALVSSFVLPRRNPNFPGNGLRWYIPLTFLFFVAMLSAVLVFGREAKEKAAASPPPPPATTSTSPSKGGGGGTGGGNAVAGKAVFGSAGCVACHTLKAAGATGTVGPNLDQLKPPLAAIVHQVEVGGGPMPAFKGRLSAQQIKDVAAFVFTSTHP